MVGMYGEQNERHMTPAEEPGHWSAERANEWYDRKPWLCGFNYLPSYAVNWIEMWQSETFDSAAIERELAWAREIGFNTLRTTTPFLLWKHDRDGLMSRLDRFLGMAARNGISVMLTQLDDCAFSGREPVLGPQPEPMKGIHNSGAVGTPGRAVVLDPTRWGEVCSYVGDVVEHFRDDTRVLCWDIYNEPGNNWVLVPNRPNDPELLPHSMGLLRAAFQSARARRPTQPITSATWNAGFREANQEIFALSDILSFHEYAPLPVMRHRIERLRAYGRPILCTEWMARHTGATIVEMANMFATERVACYQWGLVRGRTQTHLPWPHMAFPDAAPGTWFHDLLHPDGTPYDPAEVLAYQATRLASDARSAAGSSPRPPA